MRILGISAYYHDSAAALIDDGVIVAAAQEERFSRKKHDECFPHAAVRACLEAAGCRIDAQGELDPAIDHVVFYDKPFVKFERILETYLSFAPQGFATFRTGLPIWAKEKLFQRSLLTKELKKIAPSLGQRDKLLFSSHHLSHAASAFYPSPFDEALVLVLDGVGEWSTTSVALGRGSDLQIIREIPFPHSLGLLYSAFTTYAGFKVNSGEYKLMGLAPYGEPRFADTILRHLIDIKDDGTFRLDMRYFNYCTGLRMTNARFHALFGRPPRQPESPIEPFHTDLAASIQQVTETVLLRLTRALARETGQKNLCLAGGVALNCVANGKLAADGAFENIWVQPAAGDAGGALGAALAAHHLHAKQPRSVIVPDAMRGSTLGPAFSDAHTEDALRTLGVSYSVVDDTALLSETAAALAAGEVVGWFQGRMEFGPRALGNRSILADPRSSEMQKTLNLKIKFRESFRPFAPSVLQDDAADWFDMHQATSPYMLFVTTVADAHRCLSPAQAAEQRGLNHQHTRRSDIPAVTHMDFSARVQTVSARDNPRYHALLQAFKQQTGCPMLINTSFNVRGEPIVCTPQDAVRCFLGTGMDRLVIGNCVLKKSDQPTALLSDYHLSVEAD
ncbi:carbamoyltransferase family protein [Insolitispirillum peregrinum]|uniref:carbamoyltransferase family protein n=1 Tax=Insolitispirillum peregrinum TaxID=80876 RepID=UPI00360726F0